MYINVIIIPFYFYVKVKNIIPKIVLTLKTPCSSICIRDPRHFFNLKTIFKDLEVRIHSRRLIFFNKTPFYAYNFFLLSFRDKMSKGDVSKGWIFVIFFKFTFIHIQTSFHARVFGLATK